MKCLMRCSALCSCAQKRPTTHPKDYIESFTKNFPKIKVRQHSTHSSEPDPIVAETHVIFSIDIAQILKHLAQSSPQALLGAHPPSYIFRGLPCHSLCWMPLMFIACGIYRCWCSLHSDYFKNMCTPAKHVPVYAALINELANRFECLVWQVQGIVYPATGLTFSVVKMYVITSCAGRHMCDGGGWCHQGCRGSWLCPEAYWLWDLEEHTLLQICWSRPGTHALLLDIAKNAFPAMHSMWVDLHD